MRESNSGKHGTHGELSNRPLVHLYSVSWSSFGEVPFDSVCICIKSSAEQCGAMLSVFLVRCREVFCNKLF